MVKRSPQFYQMFETLINNNNNDNCINGNCFNQVPENWATADSQVITPPGQELNGWAQGANQLWGWDTSQQAGYPPQTAYSHQFAYPSQADLPLQVNHPSLVSPNTRDPVNVPLQLYDVMTYESSPVLAHDIVPLDSELTKNNGAVSGVSDDPSDENTRR